MSFRPSLQLLLLVICFSLLCGMVATSFLSAPVVAVGTLTVRDSCTDPSAGQVPVLNSTWKAQTFSPSTTYSLYYVDLAGTNLGGTTTLHIKQTSNGQPFGADLAAVSITSGNRFILTTPLPLTPGTIYALVLSNSGGSYNWSYSGSSTCYANPVGHPYTSLDSGSTWSVDIVDFNFVIYDSTSTPQPTATSTLPPTSTPRPPSNAVIKPVVFVISFPFGTPLYDPQERTETLIDKLEEASRYHGYTDLTARPYFQFQIYGGSIIRADTVPPRLADGKYDLGWVYSRYDLCNLVQQGVIDEVWLWDAGQGGFPEWVVTGPEWTQTWGFNPPNCGKQVATMIFNYNREIDEALESFHHRLEGTFMHYLPCDFWTKTWPWTGWPSQCATLVSDQYGFVARPFAGNGNVGGCGDAHHPPNILGSQEYIYNDLTTVQTICPDWSQDGSAKVTTLNCQAWGCTHWGYHVWWMQNLPGLNNSNRDRNGQPHINWWSYVFRSTPMHTQVYLPVIVR
jgi:hypothetical protein